MATLTVTSATSALDDPGEGTAPLDGEAPPHRPRPALEPGQLFGGRYRLDRLLEHGGMADVYAATDLQLRRAVALKIASGDPLRPDLAAQHLLREARVMASLNHVNIAAVHDHGRTSQGTAFVVLELITGPSLREFIAQNPTLSWRTAAGIAMQIALGLSAAHARGVVHCDLSPSNVLLAPADRNGLLCRLIDFGIACRGAEPRRSPLLGTRRYVAPERRKGGTADARLDLYALGVILGEMLARTREAPAALASLALSLQAADPRARPPSAAAAVEALRRILERSSDRSAVAARPSVRPALSRPGWALAGVATLLGIGALMAAAWVGPARPGAVASVARAAPPPVRAELQSIPVRVPSNTPEVSRALAPDPLPARRARPARPRPAAPGEARRSELEAALAQRLSPGTGAEIHLDPTGQSARIVFRQHDARAAVPRELVEYWALRDGRWQPLDGD